jgi:hypothetical protein
MRFMKLVALIGEATRQRARLVRVREHVSKAAVREAQSSLNWLDEEDRVVGQEWYDLMWGIWSGADQQSGAHFATRTPPDVLKHEEQTPHLQPFRLGAKEVWHNYMAVKKSGRQYRRTASRRA